MKFKNVLITQALAIFGALFLMSQAGQCQIPETSVGDLPQDIGSKWYSNPTMVGGLKSNTSFGRPVDYENTGKNPRGRRIFSRNEFYVGARASSGWGLFGYYNYSIRQYNLASSNGMGPEDPSLAIIHPIFDDNIVKLSGQFRQYFPASEKSGPRQTYGEAYSNTLFIKLRYGYDLGNILNLRYYMQPQYAAADPIYSTALSTSLSKHVTSWCRLGVGQHTGIEMHSGTGTGTLVQVSPSASFFITRTMFIGPRISFPVYVNGATFEGPRFVSTSQMQGELAFEAQL